MAVSNNNTDNDQDIEVGITGRTGLQADVIDENNENKLLTKSTSVPEALGDLVFPFALNGASKDMTVNGSGTPVTFTISSESGVGAKDIVINELRANAFDGGIKIDKFLGLNTSLTTGITIDVTSGGSSFSFIEIQSTADFNGHFAFGVGGKFNIIVASGIDFMSATFSPSNPFVLFKDTTDKIEITINDNLTSVSSLDFIGFGYRA